MLPARGASAALSHQTGQRGLQKTKIPHMAGEGLVVSLEGVEVVDGRAKPPAEGINSFHQGSHRRHDRWIRLGHLPLEFTDAAGEFSDLCRMAVAHTLGGRAGRRREVGLKLRHVIHEPLAFQLETLPLGLGGHQPPLNVGDSL